MHDPTPTYARLDAGISDPQDRAVAQAIAIYQTHGPQSFTGQTALAFAGMMSRCRRTSPFDATEDAGAIRDLIEVTRALIRDEPDRARHLGIALDTLLRGQANILHKVDQMAQDGAAHDTEAAS